jgi:hypothetical protein
LEILEKVFAMSALRTWLFEVAYCMQAGCGTCEFGAFRAGDAKFISYHDCIYDTYNGCCFNFYGCLLYVIRRDSFLHKMVC